MSAPDTRATGAWLFLAADLLFYGALLFVVLDLRRRAGAWPDGEARAPLAQPLLALVAAALAAALHRLRAPPLAPFAAVAAALALVAYAWQAADARALTPGAGRYGAAFYAATVLWAGHLAAGLVAAGVAILARRAETPLLGRYLALQAAAGGVLLAAVLWP